MFFERSVESIVGGDYRSTIRDTRQECARVTARTTTPNCGHNEQISLSVVTDKSIQALMNTEKVIRRSE